MFRAMETKSNSGNVDVRECTSFQLHKNQLSIFNRCRYKIFDYAEFRLLYLANTSKNKERTIFLRKLIVDYKLGNVAIAWNAGEPIWISITKEN